ncbi:MAG: hypothetical protein ACPLZC_06490 [Candidatus Bathyarchaeales archaeon]
MVKLQNPLLKLLFAALACGVIASLATGLFENKGQIGIPENKYYGYPLVWRITSIDGSTQYMATNFALNFGFCFIISFLVLLFLWKFLSPELGMGISAKTFLLLASLFIPLGIVMDFTHELGHALWGTIMGGTITYMQIAYFQIYPQIAITPQFVLGSTMMEGLAYGSFAYGMMLLGGSLTTNIASWVLTIILLKTSFGNKKQIALKILGLFGVADLPFYVVFPQIGLNHWIFLGGSTPEPLIGARMMGVPDGLFYIFVAASTFGLILLHFKSLREKVLAKLKAIKKLG